MHLLKHVRIQLKVAFCFALCLMGVSSNTYADENVQTLVRKHYPHGLPYAKAKQFGRDSVGTLLEMLRNPGDSHYWENIVTTLGMIGDERAVEPLIAFLERDVRGEVGSRTIAALVQVPRALGNIAGNGSKEALNYLLDNSTLDAWQRKSLPWTYGDQPATVVFGTALYKSVIIALGFTGTPKAIETLERLKTDSGQHSDYRSAASEALEIAEDIKGKGRGVVLSTPRKAPRSEK